MSRPNNRILAADIGGTNARFGCVERLQDKSSQVNYYSTTQGSRFLSFEDALRTYIDSLEVQTFGAAFAAAGPLEAGYINLTNTDWQTSSDRNKQQFGFTDCGLYNDFAGMTRSIAEMPKSLANYHSWTR